MKEKGASGKRESLPASGPSSRFAVFGQDFHLEESRLAITLAQQFPDRPQLRQALIAQLPQPSLKTRTRLAEKLLQRLVAADREIASAFLRLAGHAGPQVQRDLIFWQVALTDALVGAVAREICYPHFVQRLLPTGMSQQEFRLANTGGLFEDDRVITRRLVFAYAEKSWQFSSRPTLSRSLRILRQAGLIEEVRAQVGRRRTSGFIQAPREVTLEAFIFWLSGLLLSQPGWLAADEIQSGEFPRTLLLAPLQVSGLLGQGERRGLVTRRTIAGASRFSTRFTGLAEVVEALLWK